MEKTLMGQTFYPQEADARVPDGCIAVGNEHDGCMDPGRDCSWCFIYYNGPKDFDAEQQEVVEAPGC